MIGGSGKGESVNDTLSACSAVCGARLLYQYLPDIFEHTLPGKVCARVPTIPIRRISLKDTGVRHYLPHTYLPSPVAVSLEL